jgi:hypothetical protein
MLGGHLGTYKGFDLAIETQGVGRGRIWKGIARKYYSEEDGLAVALETTGLSLQRVVKQLHQIVDQWREVNGGSWHPDE